MKSNLQKTIVCSICGEGGKIRRGLCGKHYQRWKKHGGHIAERLIREPNMSLLDFDDWFYDQLKYGKKVSHMPSRCLEWQKAKHNGYGVVGFQGKRHTTHRMAWFLYHGKCQSIYATYVITLSASAYRIFTKATINPTEQTPRTGAEHKEAKLTPKPS